MNQICKGRRGQNIYCRTTNKVAGGTFYRRSTKSFGRGNLLLRAAKVFAARFLFAGGNFFRQWRYRLARDKLNLPRTLDLPHDKIIHF